MSALPAPPDYSVCPVCGGDLALHMWAPLGAPRRGFVTYCAPEPAAEEEAT